MSVNTLNPSFAPATPDKDYRNGVSVMPVPDTSGIKNPPITGKSPSHGLTSSSLDPMDMPRPERATTPGNDSVNGDSEWSSAIGRASVGGKSGRVIERLMGEVDKLKRELNLAQARVEEEQARSLSARDALDSLRGTKENLEAICETNRNVIARRDRKIEELKHDLEGEKTLRITAEKEQNELSVEMQTLTRECEKEVFKASEVAARATAECETFRKSLQRMKADWEKHLAQMRKELEVIQQDRDSEKSRLRSLSTLCDVLRAEQLRMATAYTRIDKEYTTYRISMDNSVREMAQQIAMGDAANQQLNTDLQKTLGDMKWVMNVHQNVPSLRNNEFTPEG